MIIEEMTITNNRGDSITFGRHFFIRHDFGISGLGASVHTSDTTSDGAYYNGTTLNVRDITIPFYLKKLVNEPWWVEEKRAEMYTVCNPKLNPMRMDFKTKSGQEYYAFGNLTATAIFYDGFENNNRKWQTGLIQAVGTDGLIYKKADTHTDIAVWHGNLEFPLEIPEGGIEVGYREASLIKNVVNLGSSDVGMTIVFRANSSVINPSIINVNTYETLKLNFEMQAGDEIEVTTYKGNRRIWLTRNNVRSSIFNSFNFEESKFLQLRVGDNLFRYDVDGGAIESLSVRIIHRDTVIGV